MLGKPPYLSPAQPSFCVCDHRIFIPESVKASSLKFRESYQLGRAQMALQPNAEQPHATGAPGTFGQPRAVDPRARFQIPVIPVTKVANDLNIKSAGSATLPSRLRASCSQHALLRVLYC